MKQERIIYEEQPFYSLERVPKPRENGFGTRYLVKLAVAGAVCILDGAAYRQVPFNSLPLKPGLDFGFIE